MIDGRQDSVKNKASIRITQLLECLAEHHRDTVSLADLSRLTRIPKPTAFRILNGLQDAGLVAHDDVAGGYFLGHKLMQFGAKSLDHNFYMSCLPSIKRMAQETGDTAFAVVNQNSCLECVLRISGDFPIRSLSLDVGDIWPLGVGGVGVALLASYPDIYVNQYLDTQFDQISRYQRLDRTGLWDVLQRTRNEGVADLRQALLTGVAALGVGIHMPGCDHAIGAISVAAITERLEGQRQDDVSKMLLREKARVEANLARRLEPDITKVYHEN